MDKIRTTVEWGRENLDLGDREDAKKQKYSCKCGAHDYIKYVERTKTTLPPMINCWKCKAGFQVSPEDMLKNGKGMTLNSIGSG